jgi:hypothetical protein
VRFIFIYFISTMFALSSPYLKRPRVSFHEPKRNPRLGTEEAVGTKVNGVDLWAGKSFLRLRTLSMSGSE